MTDKRLLLCGRRIRELREENDWYMEDLAQKTGLSIGSIHNYENAVKAPGYFSLLKLVEVFDENAEYIMGLSDVRRVKKEAK